MKIVIIANPVAGRGRAYKIIHNLVEHWPHRDWEYEFLSTRCPEHAGVLAMEQLSNPPDLLAVCGGDGTLHEVVSRVPDPPFPVALLPAGTANVLARDLGLPFHPARALEVALKRAVRRVDLGTLKARAEHSFILMAGIGFDAYVASRVRPAVKQRLGMFAYAASTLRALASYGFPEFHVSAGGQDFTATSCLVANAKGYGGGLVFTPMADMGDGLFDVIVLEGRPRLGYMHFLWNAWRGRPKPYSWIRQCRAPNVKITGPKGLWVQADGELIGSIPLEIDINPKAFPLVVSQT
ncbi:MAG TPA: diacylglycerol kinase family protein [Acidobacteriota bacterium]|nr:diacylglycerol kinase family protein [Acidobacteriota bacterium]